MWLPSFVCRYVQVYDQQDKGLQFRWSAFSESQIGMQKVPYFQLEMSRAVLERSVPLF